MRGICPSHTATPGVRGLSLTLHRCSALPELLILTVVVALAQGGRTCRDGDSSPGVHCTAFTTDRTVGSPSRSSPQPHRLYHRRSERDGPGRLSRHDRYRLRRLTSTSSSNGGGKGPPGSLGAAKSSGPSRYRALRRPQPSPAGQTWMVWDAAAINLPAYDDLATSGNPDVPRGVRGAHVRARRRPPPRREDDRPAQPRRCRPGRRDARLGAGRAFDAELTWLRLDTWTTNEQQHHCSCAWASDTCGP